MRAHRNAGNRTAVFGSAAESTSPAGLAENKQYPASTADRNIQEVSLFLDPACPVPGHAGRQHGRNQDRITLVSLKAMRGSAHEAGVIQSGATESILGEFLTSCACAANGVITLTVDLDSRTLPSHSITCAASTRFSQLLPKGGRSAIPVTSCHRMVRSRRSVSLPVTDCMREAPQAVRTTTDRLSPVRNRGGRAAPRPSLSSLHTSGVQAIFRRERY